MKVVAVFLALTLVAAWAAAVITVQPTPAAACPTAGC